jgi:hypothetical protein
MRLCTEGTSLPRYRRRCVPEVPCSMRSRGAGAHVAARPELLRRVIRDGDEIGVHTFTHPDLPSLPA